ncbi:MAG: hypothetical protein EA377_07985 [Phycisphaerales bacterium]|nr:MAG: hypothetical protein EA377_07985 [Phycisphaerales bacterium]
MSSLVARIPLTTLMLPAAALVYTLFVVLGFELIGWQNEVLIFLLGGSGTFLFVLIYWLGLWGRHVNWAGGRRWKTILLGGAAIGFTIPIAAVFGFIIELSFGIFIGSLVAILVWLIGTTLIWKETSVERADRLRSRIGTNAIVCPSCGYNLTGLRESSCPECGAKFTLDQLFAGQPHQEAAQLAAPEMPPGSTVSPEAQCPSTPSG